MDSDINSLGDQGSVFNQALFIQTRLNDVMKEVNKCNINPLAWNVVYNNYNYETIFNCLSSFYKEVRPKFGKDIREPIDKLEEFLGKYIQDYKPFREIRKINTDNQRVLDKKIWRRIQEGLKHFQNLVMDAADKKGLGNPDKENAWAGIVG